MEEGNHKIIVITGAAGYIGLMLVHKFLARPDVEKIIAIDKDIIPQSLQNQTKIHYMQSNLADVDWNEEVGRFSPTLVIHTAWQIREIYGKKEEQYRWNIVGSNKVFDFVFDFGTVKKLVHFSTVSSYGAFPENKVDDYLDEDSPFREEEYLYGVEKKIVEQNLYSRYLNSEKMGKITPHIFVVRPASITGPMGRYGRMKFGLQSALSGQLKGTIIHKIVSLLVSRVPITKKWCRQFIHEDDVVDIVEYLGFDSMSPGYNVYNICPAGGIVTGQEIARAVNKKSIMVSPYLIRPIFFLMWHLTRGKIPTSAGGWRFYSFPIVVDGSRITEREGYNYKYNSRDPFVKKEGRYSKLAEFR